MPAKKRKTKKRKTTTRRKKTTSRKSSAGRKKTARRSKTARRTTSKRKTAARRKTSTTVTLSTNAIKSAYTKSQLMTEIAQATELSKKDISNVFEALSNVMHRHLKKGGARQFTVPGLMKCVVKSRPARPARKGINPFTGEETTFKAKPATNVVKLRPLKTLKDMVK